MENSTSPITQTIETELTTTNEPKKALTTIARNTSSMLGAQTLIKILSFVFSVYVVRRLGAEDFGRYSTVMATAFLFAMFTELGTSALSLREMSRDDNNISWMVPNIIVIRIILSSIVIIGITLSSWVLGRAPDIVLATFIASLGLLLYAFQGPFETVLVAMERLDLSSALNLLNQIIFIGFGTIILLHRGGYVGLLIITLFGIAIMGIGSAIAVRKIRKVKFELPHLRFGVKLVKESMPFGIIGIISEFTQRFGIVYMSFILTYAAVGFYNVSYNLIITTLLLAQSLGLAMFPTMVKQYDSGKGSIQDITQRAMRYLLIISLPITIGGMLIAEKLLPFLYGQDFIAAVPIMQIMVWSIPFMFLAEVLGRGSIAMHFENKTAFYVSLNGLLIVIMSLLFIPKFGVIGAAIVLVVGRTVNVLIAIKILGKKIVFEGNVIPLLRILLANIIMGVFIWVLSTAGVFDRFDTKVSLLVFVGSGIVVYILAIIVLKAITPGEAKYLLNAISRKPKI